MGRTIKRAVASSLLLMAATAQADLHALFNQALSQALLEPVSSEDSVYTVNGQPLPPDALRDEQLQLQALPSEHYVRLDGQLIALPETYRK